MTSEKETLIYQKIARVSSIAIPIIFIFATIISVAIFFIAGTLLLGSGEITFDDNVEIDLNTISIANRIILAISFTLTLACLVRFFWQLINVAKSFKVGEVFSDTTAKYAHAAASSLLVLQCLGIFIGVYGAYLSGNLKLNLPGGFLAILFAYLFAWVLKIGSQLKAENDLTV